MSVADRIINNEILYKRARVYVQYIYRKEEKALEIESVVNNIAGVKYCKANEFTGSLLIVYDDKITNEHFIKKQIYKFVSKKVNSNSTINIGTDNSLINKKKLILKI